MVSVWVETRESPKGDIYRVVWREIAFDQEGKPYNGERRTGTFVLDAKTVNQQKQNKIAELEAVSLGVQPKRSPKSIKEAAATYLDHCQRHKAHRTYRNFDKPNVESFMDFMEKKGTGLLVNLKTEDVQAWEKTFDGDSPNGIGIRLRALKTFLNYCHKATWIEAVPYFHIPDSEEVGRVLSAKELSRLFSAAPAHVRRGLTILLYTGMRLGELFSLLGEDLKPCDDGTEAMVKTLKRKKGEGRRYRMVLLHHLALEAIGSCGPGPVMSITRNAFEASFKKLVKALKMPRTRLHDFRHTWATRFMEMTGDLFSLMRLGGWNDLKSVERYQHLTRGRSKANLKLDFGLHKHPTATQEDATRRKTHA